MLQGPTIKEMWTVQHKKLVAKSLPIRISQDISNLLIFQNYAVSSHWPALSNNSAHPLLSIVCYNILLAPDIGLMKEYIMLISGGSWCANAVVSSRIPAFTPKSQGCTSTSRTSSAKNVPSATVAVIPSSAPVSVTWLITNNACFSTSKDAFCTNSGTRKKWMSANSNASAANIAFIFSFRMKYREIAPRCVENCPETAATSM